MNAFVKERLFMYSPLNVVDDATRYLKEEYPELGNNPVVAHDLLSWCFKKSFSDLSGLAVDGWTNDPAIEKYYSCINYYIDQFVFDMVQDIGIKFLKEEFRCNLVLTKERLILITYQL